MNPEHAWKAACVVGAALAGIFAGKEISNQRHKPVYEKQHKRCKTINEMSRKKNYNS